MSKIKSVYQKATEAFRQKRKIVDANKDDVNKNVRAFLKQLKKGERKKTAYDYLLNLHRSDEAQLQVVNFLRDLSYMVIEIIAKEAKLKMTDYVHGYIKYIKSL